MEASTPNIPPPIQPGGNQWVRQMLKMPADMVTGTADDAAALAAGTFSDEVRVDFKFEPRTSSCDTRLVLRRSAALCSSRRRCSMSVLGVTW